MEVKPISKQKITVFRVMNPALRYLVFAAVFYSTQNFAIAQYYTGAVASGAGGAGRAAAEVSETALLNPATIAHAPDFSAATYFTTGDLDSTENTQIYGLTLVDNNSEAFFPGSLSFLRRHRDYKSLPSVEDNYINASIGGFFYHQFAMGLSVLRLEQKIKRGKKYEQWNGVVGMHYTPTPDLGLGLVVYNMAQVDEDIPQDLQLIPKVSAGLSYIINQFVRVRFDLSREERFNPNHKLIYNGGLESFLNGFLILRLGVSRDDRLQITRYTGGLSFDGPQFKLDYAYGQNEDQANGALHSVDLRIPF